jgi:hypothetical protein
VSACPALLKIAEGRAVADEKRHAVERCVTSAGESPDCTPEIRAALRQILVAAQASERP